MIIYVGQFVSCTYPFCWTFPTSLPDGLQRLKLFPAVQCSMAASTHLFSENQVATTIELVETAGDSTSMCVSQIAQHPFTYKLDPSPCYWVIKNTREA